MSQLTHSTYGRVICCAQGTCWVWTLMQFLIHRASVWALLEDEQKFKLGGVLTAIISHSDYQLLGNKLSFQLCSIHILFNSNKFHKFWMSCDFRWTCTKNVRIWVKTQADRPLLGRPPGTPTNTTTSSIQRQCDTFKYIWAEDWMSVWSNGPKGLHKDQWTHNSV